MHIAIDTSATFLTRAGTATYIRGLIHGIRGIAPETKISEFACRPFFNRRRKVLRTLDTIYRDLIWAPFVLPRLARRAGADVLHCPAMTAPLGTGPPVVLTVLDAGILRSPGSFPPWQRLVMGRLLRPGLKSAAAVICISAFTKSELRSLFPALPAAKLTTTLLGVEPAFRPVADPDTLAAFKEKHAIDRPFILSVSTIEPRKNLKTLLAAFAAIKDAVPHDLLLVGPPGWSNSDLGPALARLGISRRVRLMGFLDRGALPAAYSLAGVFAYLSLYEGFGLPPLEAMSCGCPVVCSRAASLPEVVGEAALTVDPLAVQDVAAALLAVIENPSLRASLVGKGLARARLFTWSQCAETTLDVYRRVVDRQAPSGKDRQPGMPGPSANRQ